MMPSSWFYTSLCFFFFANIFTDSIDPTIISYSDHCSSIVPESSSTIPTYDHSVPHILTSYFTGGDKLKDRKKQNQTHYYFQEFLKFSTGQRSYETITKGVYKVEAFLSIFSGRFELKGFWSEISKNLCMVGSASWLIEEGKVVHFDAVLKLNFHSENNPTMHTSVVSGTLESINSADDDEKYFDPVMIFSFPVLPNYNYSLVSKQLHGGGLFSNFKAPENNLPKNKFCSVLSRASTFLELEYAIGCSAPDHHHCSPIGGLLPQFLFLNPIQCLAGARKLRYVLTFQNISYGDKSFRLDSTLIAEASWDDKKNELFLVACRMLDPSYHLGSAVGDCSMRLSFRSSSIWNVKNDPKIIGQIWSTKAVGNSAYLKNITLLSSDQTNVLVFPGLRYEYTEFDRLRKLCPVKKPVKKGNNKYPKGHSHDMNFDSLVENQYSNGDPFAMAYATPISVGNELFEINDMIESRYSGFAANYEPEISNYTSTLNISYKIIIDPFANQVTVNNFQRRMEITAEGVYNAETGDLCMVGCTKLMPSYSSRDCEILIKFKFAYSGEKGSPLVKGTVESTRAKTDPFYFEDLSMTSSSFYPSLVDEMMWKIDSEMPKLLKSNMFWCIFVGVQIFYVKRYPNVLSSISLVMLVILSLGCVIQIVISFKAMFLRNYRMPEFVRNDVWYEATEIFVDVIAIVTLLLLIRLLQLVWGAKMGDGAWMREIKAMLVLLALYVLGGFACLFLNWLRNIIYQEYDHQFYVGLILDGFLLPQIILNALRGSSEKALCRPFYVGISAVRLVSHAYDQYKAYGYQTFDGNPIADYYSTAWDIIVHCGVIALAVIIFLQQRNVDRWIVELELYNKVPTVDKNE